MVERIAHTLVKERRLQPTTPQLWNRRGAAKQCNPLMKTQHASGARLIVKLGKKAQTLLAR
jgi:hypothetical protein